MMCVLSGKLPSRIGDQEAKIGSDRAKSGMLPRMWSMSALRWKV
jgi:hypothetical protein